MSEASSNTTHWAIGAILLFIGAFVVVALVLVYSQADSVDTSVNINNANPVVDSIFVSSSPNGLSNDFGAGIGLVAGGDKTVHINGVVSDANGAEDIQTVLLKFYRLAKTDTCTPDSNDCYGIPSCTLTSNNATSKKYNCSVNLKFWSDSTDSLGRFSEDIWKSKVSVDDYNSGSGSLTSNGANDVEVNTLLSLDIPVSINYATRSNNTSSDAGNNVDMVITQTGNDVADIEVSGTVMTCDGTGSINLTDQSWALVDVPYGDVSTDPISGTPAETGIDVPYRDLDGTPMTKTLHWNIHIPYEAVGSCTGTNTLNVIAG